MTAHITFVTHDCSRTGAPSLLLHLMSWLNRKPQFNMRTVYRRGGDLVPEFNEFGPTINLGARILGTGGWMGRMVRLGPPGRSLFHRHCQRVTVQSLYQGTSLLYLNTVASLAALDSIPLPPIPTIVHVHELEHVINEFSAGAALQQLANANACFIAASQVVKHSMVQQFQIPNDRIWVVNAFIPEKPRSDDMANARSNDSLRQELGISEHVKIVLGAGQISWRKGTDWFVAVAHALQGMMPPDDVCFVWVGGPTTGAYFNQLRYDAERLGVADRIRWVGLRSDIDRFYEIANVFAMTSREDPFPLVMLEAARAGVPMVCYDGSGGPPEFAEHDSGLIAPYGDTVAMAEHIHALLSDPDRFASIGHAARDKVDKRYTLEVSAPKILNVIQTALNAKRPGIE